MTHFARWAALSLVAILATTSLAADEPAKPTPGQPSRSAKGDSPKSAKSDSPKSTRGDLSRSPKSDSAKPAAAPARPGARPGPTTRPGGRRNFSPPPRTPAIDPASANPAELSPANPYEQARHVAPQSELDKLVIAQLDKLGLAPARPCSDAVFLRRVYLDVIGTLPQAQEARAFLNDKSPDKRARLIDRLLADDRYADYWANRWSDWLRVRAEFPINLWPNAAQAYHRWIHTSLRDNVPYDQLAQQLLTASGSNFREPAVNFYRAIQGREPQAIAQAVALTFLGSRLESWPKERRDNLTAFFSQVGYKATLEWKEEIVFHKHSLNPDLKSATLPDGSRVDLSAGQDPRRALADWLVDPKRNPQFARAAANRLWASVFGRGIVHEVDDFRDDNPPANPALLDYLAGELVRAKFDSKALLRLILNSRTYQQSFIPAGDDPRAAEQFAFYPLRRLEAEVLIDALNQITGASEKYSSAIPEPFTFIPDSHRAISLPDGSITSSFLEMFGRPSRDTGLFSERNNGHSPAQRLHMLNSSHIQRKIEQGWRLRRMMQLGRPRENVVTLYLTILSRYPTLAELTTIAAYGEANQADRINVANDLAWSLFNSAEFLHRH